MQRILLAEDDVNLRRQLEDHLRGCGWQVKTAASTEEAHALLTRSDYHLVLGNSRLCDPDLLRRVGERSPHTGLFLMSASGSLADGLAWLDHGAADYLRIPFAPDDLLLRVHRFFVQQTAQTGRPVPTDRCRSRYGGIIGRSEPIRRLFSLIDRIGPTDSTVLITGESGTGKELAATALHRASGRAHRPCVRINCAAIPEGLLESELFGYERGAFTGALARKPGRFELADHGTLLLDEIGELPLGLQAKLLRVIECGECQRLGGTQTIRTDVRLLCATARDLKQEAAAGRFRQDLRYRLSVIPLHMPTLRERPEDIPLLAAHFLRLFSRRRGCSQSLANETLACLQRYDFPGNVRELKNIIEQVSVLAAGPVIGPADLPVEVQPCLDADEEAVRPLGEAVAGAERQCILRGLARCGGNRSQTAALLGISRKNLWEKMRRHGIGGTG
jgi:two-component system response regulator AtoC